jgi:hypothetical protein
MECLSPDLLIQLYKENSYKIQLLSNDLMG